jgi:WD40 repeat protein
MAFDVYPAGLVPLRLRTGEPSALIPLRVRAAVDPATGRTVMYLALVKLGTGCAAPGPPDPTIRLRAGAGDPVEVAGPEATPVRAMPGDGGPPAALATRTAAGPDRYRIDVEILESGHEWFLQIEHHGPLQEHEFTWVVADAEAETAQPWIDVPADAVGFRVKVGHHQVQPVTIGNRGTGTLTLRDADGADLGSGFTLDGIGLRTVEPHACATAHIGFTGATPGDSSARARIASDDPAAAAASHPQTLTLRATTVEPVRLVSRIEGPDDGGTVALSPDGSLLAVSSARFRFVGQDTFFDGGFVRVHDTDTGALRATATVDKFIWSVTFDPAGKRIAVTSGGDVWMVDALTGAQLWHFFSWGDAIPPSFEPDSRHLMIGWNGLVCPLDTDLGAPLWELTTGGHGADQVRAVALSPDGQFVAVGSGESSGFSTPGRLRLLDAASGQLRWSIDRPDSVARLAFSGDGSALVIGGSGSSAAIVDAATGAVGGPLPQPPDPPREMKRVAFSPDGRLAATSDVFGVSRIFDVADRTLVQTFQRAAVVGPDVLAFTPDSRSLVLPGPLNRVRVVDPLSGVEQASAEYPVLPVEVPADPNDLSHIAAWVVLGRDARRLVIAGRRRAVVYDPQLDVP